MNAKEYFIEKNSKEEYEAQSYDYTPADLVEFAEAYHNAKSKEEAEERYEIAKYCLGCDSSGIRLRTTPLIEHAIKLAAFGKEDKE
jgi:hypothetical protein